MSEHVKITRTGNKTERIKNISKSEVSVMKDQVAHQPGQVFSRTRSTDRNPSKCFDGIKYQRLPISAGAGIISIL